MRACWGLLKPRAANGHITYPWLSFCILKELHVCNLTNYMRHTKEKYQKNKGIWVTKSSSRHWLWQCRYKWKCPINDQQSAQTNIPPDNTMPFWAVTENPQAKAREKHSYIKTWEIQNTSTWSVCRQIPFIAVESFKLSFDLSKNFLRPRIRQKSTALICFIHKKDSPCNRCNKIIQQINSTDGLRLHFGAENARKQVTM